MVIFLLFLVVFNYPVKYFICLNKLFEHFNEAKVSIGFFIFRLRLAILLATNQNIKL